MLKTYTRINYMRDRIDLLCSFNPVHFHSCINRTFKEWYGHHINDIPNERIKKMQIGGKVYRSRKINRTCTGKIYRSTRIIGTRKGGNSTKIREIEFIESYHNHKYRVHIEKQEDEIFINILSHEKSPQFCSVIVIDKKKKLAILQNISYYKKCAIPDLIDRGGGSTILKFVLSFLRSNKKQFKINRIVLKDNSLKPCKNCNKPVNFAMLHFLLYGDTWYGKYGFRPYDVNGERPNDNKIKIYEKNQNILANTKVKDINLSRYIRDAINMIHKENKHKNIIDINVKMLDKQFEKSKNEPLSKMLKAIMYNYDKYCCLFNHIGPMIYQRLKLTDFYTDNFYLDI